MDQKFKTKDMILSCYLAYNDVEAEKICIEVVKKGNGDVRKEAYWFYSLSETERKDDLEALVHEFNSGLGSVEPYGFWRTVNRVRGQMMVELGIDRRAGQP